MFDSLGIRAPMLGQLGKAARPLSSRAGPIANPDRDPFYSIKNRKLGSSIMRVIVLTLFFANVMV